MNKIAALFNLLRRGGEVGNAAAWKNRTIVANLIVAILGVAAAFGYKVDVDTDTITALAAGLVAAVCVFNGVVHVITDKRVGVGVPPVDRTSTEIGSGSTTQVAAPDIRDPGGA